MAQLKTDCGAIILTMAMGCYDNLVSVFFGTSMGGSAPNTQDCGELILAMLMIDTTICGVYLELESEGSAPCVCAYARTH